VKEKWGRLGRVSVGAEGLLIGVGVARRSQAMFPSLSAVGSWKDVFLQDFTASPNFFEFVLQDAHFCLKKLALAFLTACVYYFLTSLKSCISRGLFDANAEHHRMFLCWSRTVRSGVNQGIYLFLVTFL
jgi:hypothetical protein